MDLRKKIIIILSCLPIILALISLVYGQFLSVWNFVYVVPLVYSIRIIMKDKLYFFGLAAMFPSFLMAFGNSMGLFYSKHQSITYTYKMFSNDLAVLTFLSLSIFFLVSTLYIVKLIRNKEYKFAIPFLVLSILGVFYFGIMGIMSFIFSGNL